MVDELNSTKDQGGEVRERSTEPATLTPQQLNQVQYLENVCLGIGSRVGGTNRRRYVQKPKLEKQGVFNFNSLSVRGLILRRRRKVKKGEQFM